MSSQVTEPAARRKYGGASAEQRKADRNARMLDAAFEIIGSQGYKAATVRAVCRQAGLTQRYYYEAFSDAEDMLEKVYRREIEKLTLLLTTAAIGNGPLPDRLRSALTKFLAAVKKDPRTGRVIFFEILGVSDRIDLLYQRTTGQFVNLAAGFIDTSLSGRMPAGVDTAIAARAAVGAVIQVATHWQLSGFKETSGKIAGSLASMVEAVLPA